MRLAVDLSPDSLAALQSAREAAVDVGDVYSMPGECVRDWFNSDKDGRPCVVARVETTANGSQIAHLVAGSTARGAPPKVVEVPAGEVGLRKTTYFKFMWSGSIPVSELIAKGRHRGRLPKSRIVQLEAAVAASGLTRLRDESSSTRHDSRPRPADADAEPHQEPEDVTLQTGAGSANLTGANKRPGRGTEGER